MSKKRVLLFYPPGALFQRGEDRCQQNIDDKQFFHSLLPPAFAKADKQYSTALLTILADFF